MSDEGSTHDEDAQPVKCVSENDDVKASSSGSNEQGIRGRGRGNLRGRRGSRVTGDNLNSCSIGTRGRGRGIPRDSSKNEHDSNSNENRGRGGVRGRGGRGDFHSKNEDNINRNRGRGGSYRGKQRKQESNSNNGISDSENWDSDSDKPKIEEIRQSRGLTPPRGARGRTRSSSGRFSELGVGHPGNKEDNVRSRGRGRGTGRTRHIVSRSDGEDSDQSDEARTHRGRGRGRGNFERSKSFRGAASGGSVPFRGGRGRGGRGRGKSTEPEKKVSEKYIPPDPTEDEDIMFHSGISTGVHFNKYDTIVVNVTGNNPPQPIHTFDTAGLCHILLENIKKSDYKKPTPVQKNAIPIISTGRDLMACAQTGSGKTAAFLIPVINDLLNWSGDLVTGSCVEPLVVVLSPTRELAIQIFQEARKFSHGSSLKIALLYGGTVSEHQLNLISRGCHILVAVPGRLENFVKMGHVKFSSVKYFILDEADRMLELGFKDSMKMMLKHETMTKLGERRTLMFSATFPQEIQQLAANYLHNYLFLAVGVVGGACSDVQQLFLEVKKFDKREKLLQILKERKADELTLVFVGMRRHADFLAVYLCENDIPTTSIHGGRYQSQREEALADFKSGEMPILIATAVAARGLDIKNVAHVINYDLPGTIEEYVHRIGRTGRVGNCGKSTSFYDPNSDRLLAKSLVNILEQAGQPIPDFLRSEAADSRYNEVGLDEFAGTDIRTAKSNKDGGSTQEEEECWD